MSAHEHPERTSGEGTSGEDCAEFLDRIVYFLDNELDAADCAVVQVHLAECGPCLERYDLQRAVKALVARSCSESAPESLRERVRIQIRQVRVQITEGQPTEG